jgi:hypothetical protein
MDIVWLAFVAAFFGVCGLSLGWIEGLRGEVP